MNNKYQLGFVLGRDVAISIAEICAVLGKMGIDFEMSFPTKDILIVSSDDISLENLNINDFGGIIKIFKTIGFSDQKSLSKFIIKNVYPIQTEKRINFGISGYGQIQKKYIYNLGKEIKTYFIESNFSVRFVTGRDNALSSVIVTENKLLERGFELILVQEKNKFIIGLTAAVQNYKAYSTRDFGRPKRDDRNGMLPPKIAQVMINLARASKDAIIYDPFCGSGTILQEALVLGYKNIYGSDISQKQVNDSKANLNWFEQKFNTINLEKNHLLLADATKYKPSFKVDTIICEGFLGEPIKRNYQKAKDDAEKLAKFYIDALKNMVNMIDSKGKIILAIPFFIIKNEYIYLPIIDNLKKIGLKVSPPFPKDINVKLFGRGNLTYNRSDQFVGREILILSKA